jgi:hypothetical protein
MSKNKLGLRRARGGGGTSRISGLAAGRTGGLAPNVHLKRPYQPEMPQQNVRDGANTGRVKGLGAK